MSIKNMLVQKISDLLDTAIGEITNNLPVIKQFNDEKMEAIEYLYTYGEEDAHGEQMTLDEIRKMVDSLNRAVANGKLKSNINHSVDVEGFHVVKAWVNECDCMIGDTLVLEGFPLVKIKFTDKRLWEARKSGELMGISIGAIGEREVMND